MTFAMSTALALFTATATVPASDARYSLDISVKGPRAEADIRPQLVEAFAPCIEKPTADVTLRTEIDRGGVGEVRFTYAHFEGASESRLLPNNFNELSTEAKQAAVAKLDSCLAGFQIEDLKLPVIQAEQPTVVEARLVFHP